MLGEAWPGKPRNFKPGGYEMLVDVEIRGISSLIQHRFGEAAEGDTEAASRTVNVTRGTPREEAEKVQYKDSKTGRFYHPGQAIARLLREAGSNHKQKGSRRSLKYIIPAAVLVPEDKIVLTDGNGSHPKDFEVDSRPVVIPSTKGRIMRHRPRFDEWGMRFSLEVDEEVLPADMVHQLLCEGGRRVGLGDFRPEKGGPFGRFGVTKWQEQKPAVTRRVKAAKK